MSDRRRVGVVLFNLGGPDQLSSVEPFLKNLFSDPAIIRVPGFVRWFLARLIARRRGPYAREMYRSIGGGSPIVAETKVQAEALKLALGGLGIDAHVVIAMRYWHPMTGEAVAGMALFAPDDIVLLPLYPQYSTTTTQSSLDAFMAEAGRAGLLGCVSGRVSGIGCYPENEGFVGANVSLLREAMAGIDGANSVVLFSAHGLPQRIVDDGDPYPRQVEASAAAIAKAYGAGMPEWRVTYQSRVGPLKWIGPDTDAQITAQARRGRTIIVVPLSFVSEHLETLYELDQIYRALAIKQGAKAYIRVKTAGTHPAFISGLARLVAARIGKSGIAGDAARIYCKPSEKCACRAAM